MNPVSTSNDNINTKFFFLSKDVDPLQNEKKKIFKCVNSDYQTEQQLTG